MSIAEYIHRKKLEFFIAKDTDQMAEQAAYLARERHRLEEDRLLRQQVIEGQAAVRSLRQENTSDRLGILGHSTPERFFAMSQKANHFFHGNEPPGLIQAHQRRLKNLPEPSGGLFERNL